MPEEKIYVINLGRVYWSGRERRAARAMRMVKEYLLRHTKAERLIIDESVNEYIYSQSFDKPPRRVAVRVVQVDDEGKVLKAALAVPVEEAPAEKRMEASPAEEGQP